MAKLRLLYFAHIMTRQGSLENIMILGKVEEEDSSKRGNSNITWIHSRKEARDRDGQGLKHCNIHKKITNSLICIHLNLCP